QDPDSLATARAAPTTPYEPPAIRRAPPPYEGGAACCFRNRPRRRNPPARALPWRHASPIVREAESPMGASFTFVLRISAEPRAISGRYVIPRSASTISTSVRMLVAA